MEVIAVLLDWLKKKGKKKTYWVLLIVSLVIGWGFFIIMQITFEAR